jgi:hypothetical protein
MDNILSKPFIMVIWVVSMLKHLRFLKINQFILRTRSSVSPQSLCVASSVSDDQVKHAHYIH